MWCIDSVVPSRLFQLFQLICLQFVFTTAPVLNDEVSYTGESLHCYIGA